MPKTHSVLLIENLHVQIGERMILHNISLEVKTGEIVGVIGPNGCGKTTLLNAISGFLPIDTGTISINGVDTGTLPAYARVRLGVVRGFQHTGIFREMTVEENLVMAIETAGAYPWWWMFSRAWRQKTDQVVGRALAEIELMAHQKSPAGVLSGGQLRLLELAKLRLSRGNLLLIDEPIAGVAPALKNTLRESIKSLAKDHGRTIIIVEHDLGFLFDLADRVIVLVDGGKYLEGPLADVRQDPNLQKIYFGE